MLSVSSSYCYNPLSLLQEEEEKDEFDFDPELREDGFLVDHNYLSDDEGSIYSCQDWQLHCFVDMRTDTASVCCRRLVRRRRFIGCL